MRVRARRGQKCTNRPGPATIIPYYTFESTSVFAQEVDEGGTEGMLRNKTYKRLLSDRVQ